MKHLKNELVMNKAVLSVNHISFIALDKQHRYVCCEVLIYLLDIAECRLCVRFYINLHINPVLDPKSDRSVQPEKLGGGPILLGISNKMNHF